MSREWAWWSITPTTMNSGALNRAWAMINTTPASVASGRPAPNITIKKPSWLTVPNASSRLRSVWRSARAPPVIIVISATVNTTGRQNPTSAKGGANRATRYTPAFTIVAECR